MAEAKNIKDPMKNMVYVMVPKESGEDPTLFVGLNGRSWLIPRGKRVEVPEPVANIINESLRMREVNDEFSESEKEKINVVQGAPI